MMAGWLPIDPATHSAMTEIDLHHVFSVGLDALALCPYHLGSHVWFASLANLTGIRPWLFYQLGFPVIVIPLALYALMSFARAIRGRINSLSETHEFPIGFLEWFLLIARLSGLCPILSMGSCIPKILFLTVNLSPPA